MFRFILCSVMASVLLLGIALDSARWATPYAAPKPQASYVDLASTSHFPKEAQHVYQFSGAAEGVRLEDGQIVLNDYVAGDDDEVFDGGFLTVDASDITSYTYEYTVTIEGDMVFILDAGTLGNLGATFGIINEYMGTTSAKTTLYKDRGISAEDLISSLTFSLSLTHADGSVTTHILPLTVTPASEVA